MQKPEKQCVHVAEQHFMIKISTCSIMSNSCIQITRSPSHFFKQLKIWPLQRLIFPDFIIFFIINIAVYFIVDVTNDCFKAPESVPAMTLINNSSVLPVLPSVVSLTVKESPVEVTMLESRSVRAPGSSSRTSSGMDFFLAFSEIFILVIMYFII